MITIGCACFGRSGYPVERETMPFIVAGSDTPTPIMSITWRAVQVLRRVRRSLYVFPHSLTTFHAGEEHVLTSRCLRVCLRVRVADPAVPQPVLFRALLMPQSEYRDNVGLPER